MRRAENNSLPIGGGFYMGMRMSHGSQGIFRGQVVSIVSTSTFFMKHNDLDSDADDQVIEVSTPQNSDVFTLFLAPGDEVFIAGDKTSSGIRAYGIRKLTATQ